jgi:hypothetical protein
MGIINKIPKNVKRHSKIMAHNPATPSTARII